MKLKNLFYRLVISGLLLSSCSEKKPAPVDPDVTKDLVGKYSYTELTSSSRKIYNWLVSKDSESSVSVRSEIITEYFSGIPFTYLDTISSAKVENPGKFKFSYLRQGIYQMDLVRW